MKERQRSGWWKIKRGKMRRLVVVFFRRAPISGRCGNEREILSNKTGINKARRKQEVTATRDEPSRLPRGEEGSAHG